MLNGEEDFDCEILSKSSFTFLVVVDSCVELGFGFRFVKHEKKSRAVSTYFEDTDYSRIFEKVRQ